MLETSDLFTPEAERPAGYVRVALEQGIDTGVGGLTYAVPKKLSGLEVGDRVRAPLGKSNKPVAGIVVERLAAPDVSPEKVKAVVSREGQRAAMTGSLVKLARWMSAYYCSPLGMVLQSMLPAAVKRGTGRIVETWVGRPDEVGGTAADPERSGGAGEAGVEQASDGRRKLTKLQQAVLEVVDRHLEAGERWTEIHRLAELAGAKTITPVRRLIDAGELEARSQDAVRAREDGRVAGLDSPGEVKGVASPLQLNAEQRSTVEAVAATLGGFAVHLLYGVTGSGKTEVYLRAIERLRAARAAAVETGAKLELEPAADLDPALAPDPDPDLEADAEPEPESDAPADAHTDAELGAEADARPEARRGSNPPADYGVIVLVPEIALTPQTVGRFQARCRGEVAVLHSGLTASQRHEQWRRIRAGEARVVVGARSAVFAPLRRVDLIVVDEEHESTYKQDQSPRYHARDVAIKRAQLEGATVVLGSATPSLESYFNAGGGLADRTFEPDAAADSGWAADSNSSASSASSASASSASSRPGRSGETESRVIDRATPTRAHYQLHTLSRRAPGLSRPRVEIVDLIEERRHRRGVHLLSARLERELHHAARRGEQALLLLNRRGYANYIACPDPNCGWLHQCDYCDATMVYHKKPGEPRTRDDAGADSDHRADAGSGVCSSAGPGAAEERSAAGGGSGRSRTSGFTRCHHCEAEQRLPSQCPQCGKRVTVFGLGVQRVEEELSRKLPSLRIERMDSDVMRGGRHYHELLSRFASGEIDVLLGTQMISKGLDHPNVTRVGVVCADTALHLPDFRAGERTFQMVAQVAGRAGRGEASGLVIVQTFNPDDPSIGFACRADYPGFARRELALRREVGLPPWRRMARLVVRDRDLVKAHERANALAERLHAANREQGERVLLRGPAPCAISRIAEHHRLEIQLVADQAAQLQRLFTAVRNERKLVSDAHVAVDVDPVMMV